MCVSIQPSGGAANRATRVFELFDPRVLRRLWFLAISDGASVHMLAPTFQSERAARIFERCVLDHPSGFLLSIDSQLELAHRIEKRLSEGGSPDEAITEELWRGLAMKGTAQ